MFFHNGRSILMYFTCSCVAEQNAFNVICFICRKWNNQIGLVLNWSLAVLSAWYFHRLLHRPFSPILPMSWRWHLVHSLGASAGLPVPHCSQMLLFGSSNHKVLLLLLVNEMSYSLGGSVGQLLSFIEMAVIFLVFLLLVTWRKMY